MSFDRNYSIERISIFFFQRKKKKRDTFFVDEFTNLQFERIASNASRSNERMIRFKSFVRFTGLIILLLINRKFLISLYSPFFLQKSRNNYNTRCRINKRYSCWKVNSFSRTIFLRETTVWTTVDTFFNYVSTKYIARRWRCDGER